MIELDAIEGALWVWGKINHILDHPKTLSIGLPLFLGYYRHAQHARKVFEEELKDLAHDDCRVLYSEAYEVAESAIFKMARAGQDFLYIKREHGTIEKELGEHLGEVKRSISDFCDTPLPKKMVKMVIADGQYYSGKRWEQYVKDSGKRLRKWMKTAISKKCGSTEIVKEVFDTALSEEVFIDQYRTIIERARTFKRRIV